MDGDRIDEIIDKHLCERSYLIQMFLDIPAENHRLPRGGKEEGQADGKTLVAFMNKRAFGCF